MIDRKALLADLQRWVTRFENDLRARCAEVPELDAARLARRTAESWREGQISQSAVGWTLACVFVRFLEDNAPLERAFIGGAGETRAEAEHVRDEWFRHQPALSDRDYLQHVFTEVGRLAIKAQLASPGAESLAQTDAAFATIKARLSWLYQTPRINASPVRV